MNGLLQGIPRPMNMNVMTGMRSVTNQPSMIRMDGMPRMVSPPSVRMGELGVFGGGIMQAGGAAMNVGGGGGGFLQGQGPMALPINFAAVIGMQGIGSAQGGGMSAFRKL
jgi:hypothetical protein